MKARYSKAKNSRASGIVVFTVGVLIATFFGGAVRTLVSPQAIQVYIDQQILERKPKFDLVFQQARLSLAKGWWPRIGLEMMGMVIVAHDRCQSPVQLEVDQVYIPVDLWSFAQGELRFLDIEFGNVRIIKQEKQCTSGPNESIVGVPEPSVKPAEPPALAASGDFEKIQKFINTRLEKEMINTKRWMQGLRAESLTFVSFGERLQSHVFKNVALVTRGSEQPIELSFAYTPDAEVVYHQPLQDVRVRLELQPDVLKFQGQSGYKEGSLVFSGEWSLQNAQILAKSQIKNVPVVEIFQGFSKRNILPHVVANRPIWLTCEQTFSGDLTRWQEIELKIKDCLISGEAGLIKLPQATLSPFQKPLRFDPLVVQFVGFSVEMLFKAFHHPPPEQMIHSLGSLNADLVVRSPQDVLLKGEIRDLVLVFSRSGRREFQHIESLTGEMSFTDSRFSGLIADLKLKGGDYAGRVTFNLDEEFESGLFQVDVSRLALNSEVRDLIFLNGAPYLEVYGQGKIAEGAVQSWTGSFGIPSFQSEKVQLESVRFHADWKDRKWRGGLKVQSARFHQPSALFDAIHPLYLGENPQADLVHWKQVSAQLSFDGTEFVWEKASSRDFKRDIVFSSSGRWTQGQELEGSLHVDFPVLKLLKWELGGKIDSPRLAPSAKMLKELASKRPEVATPSAVELTSSQLLLPEAFGKKKTRIQEVSDKAIGKIKESVMDPAKRILGPKEQKPENSPAKSSQEL